MKINRRGLFSMLAGFSIAGLFPSRASAKRKLTMEDWDALYSDAGVVYREKFFSDNFQTGGSRDVWPAGWQCSRMDVLAGSEVWDPVAERNWAITTFTSLGDGMQASCNSCGAWLNGDTETLRGHAKEHYKLRQEVLDKKYASKMFAELNPNVKSVLNAPLSPE